MFKLNKQIVLPAFFFFLVFFSCKKKDTHALVEIAASPIASVDSTKWFQEPFRPQFHFTPEKMWMNDPNGMIYHKGTYHLFYQYYPDDIVWGPMHWGHATSTDLLHWKHKKIALYPDKLGLIFSGSVVIDKENTSGLGTKENPPMVAIFTYHNMEIEKAGKINTQSQGLAYSLDQGETWKKYDKNPIISNTTLKDFRDPKAFWNSETQTWNMTLVAGDHAQFYTSKNLINWQLEGMFGKNIGAHGGVWECPDVFKLKVENSNEEKWVLFISINPGAPLGGSGTQYFVGDYDGKNFKTSQKNVQWIDYGMDNYAGVTYNNAPDNKRIFIGWMSNWLYARNTPTQNWRSAMTLPRELSLCKINNQYVLKSKPVAQIKDILENEFASNLLVLNASEKAVFEYKNLNQSDIEFKAKAKDLKLIFSNSVNDSLVLHYEASKKTFTVDRTRSGIVNFEPHFAEKPHVSSISNCTADEVQYQIILDWSSIEIFLDEGVYSFTEQVFPRKPFSKLTIISNQNQEIKNLKINKVKRVW